MNFYSVDGSSYDNQVYQNFNNMQIEQFENTEYNNSSISDDKYQCSDKFGINGQSLITLKDISVDACKKSCVDDLNCVGFDFNNKDKTCNLYKNVTSLDKPNPDGYFCIKKDSGDCNNQMVNSDDKTEAKVYKTAYEDLISKYAEKLDSLKIISEQNEILNKRFSEFENEIKNMDEKFMENKNIAEQLSHNKKLANLIESENMNLKNEIMNFDRKEKELRDKLKERCDKENIYIDLGCFLSNMETLKNHATDMMVDLGILVSNIKACAYQAKKDYKPNKKSDQITDVTLDSLVNKIIVPKPEEISMNTTTTTNMSNMSNMSNVSTKETFRNVGPDYDFKWFSGDLLIVVVIIFLLYFIIFHKKKN